MKKTNKFALILAMLVMPVLSYGMECGDEDDFRESQTTNWHSLPNEMQQSIVSSAFNLNEIINAMGNDTTEKLGAEVRLAELFKIFSRLTLVDKQIKSMVGNPKLCIMELIESSIAQKNIGVLVPCLDQLAKLGWIDMLQFALDKGVSELTILMLASRNNQLEFSRGLIKQKAMFEEKDRELKTAICLHEYDNVKILIEEQIKTGKWWDSVGILNFAISCGNLPITKLLLDIPIPVASRETVRPLATAAKWGELDVMRLLLDLGALVDEPSLGDVTALYFAAALGQIAAADLLLTKGASIDRKACFLDQSTALISVASAGVTKMVAFLIQKGADINLMNDDGLTALMIAAQLGREEIVALLLSKNPKYVNEALSIARKNNKLKVVRILEEYLKEHDNKTDAENDLAEESEPFLS